MNLARLRLATLAAALLVPGAAPATHFDGVFIFGDSLSDSGNVAALTPLRDGLPTSNFFIPDFPYAISDRLTNGPVWVEYAAPTFGFSAVPSLLGGSNYAFAGARTSGGVVPSLLVQFGMYTAGNSIAPDALYVVAGGGNNARDAFGPIGACGGDPVCIFGVIASTASQFASDIDTIVEALEAGGAENILVWNVPNIGRAPALAGAAGLATTLAASMNAALAAALADDVHAQIFDLFGLVTELTAPGSPFVNFTDACGAPVNACDPATAFFWDGIHPTTAAHALLAQAILVAVPSPGSAALLFLGLAGLALRRGFGRSARLP